MTSVTVAVTELDIDLGEVNNCTRCPIASALRRLGVDLDVGPTSLYQRGLPLATARVATLPQAARLFIDRFDAGLHVEPLTFTVSIPSELVAS